LPAQAFSDHNFSHQGILAKHGRKTLQLVPNFLQYFEVASLYGIGNDRAVSEQSVIETA